MKQDQIKIEGENYNRLLKNSQQILLSLVMANPFLTSAKIEKISDNTVAQLTQKLAEMSEKKLSDILNKFGLPSGIESELEKNNSNPEEVQLSPSSETDPDTPQQATHSKDNDLPTPQNDNTSNPSDQEDLTSTKPRNSQYEKMQMNKKSDSSSPDKPNNSEKNLNDTPDSLPPNTIPNPNAAQNPFQSELSQPSDESNKNKGAKEIQNNIEKNKLTQTANKLRYFKEIKSIDRKNKKNKKEFKIVNKKYQKVLKEYNKLKRRKNREYAYLILLRVAYYTCLALFFLEITVGIAARLKVAIIMAKRKLTITKYLLTTKKLELDLIQKKVEEIKKTIVKLENHKFILLNHGLLQGQKTPEIMTMA